MLSALAAAQSPFATQVIAYDPAPGQFVQNPQFNDPTRAVGPPIGGGTIAPDNTKVVTLGGFGGSIVLAFDHRVLDDPRNFMGLDAIVFGNAVYVAGHPNRRFAEAATIEIAIDANNNGLADDPWYVIRVPQMPAVPDDWWATRTWDDNVADPANPPANPAWIPPGRTGTWQTSAYLLFSTPFAGPILQNPLGLTATAEAIRGIADHTPTLLLGDTTADNVIDDASIAPAAFYTVPDDPFSVGITPRSGGGDAFDIAWAVDPATGQPANLPGFDFIRLTTAIDSIDPLFGEVSAEIGGVADAAPHRIRPHVTVQFAR
ncbi:MAG: hypothetical protein R3B68_06960 [Phycisphaerales bacterium]